MTSGMIAAAQPEAVEAGIEVLRSGGNAVDAAVATALTQTAVDPQMSGLAGYGVMHVYDPARGIHRVLGFYGRAPLAVRPDMWADRIVAQIEGDFGFVLKDRANELGYGAITTPMTLHALDTALARWGTRRLGDLVEAAIGYARDGVLVRPHMAAYWNLVPTEGRAPHADLLTHFPATRKIYGKPGGGILGVGDTLKNPDMATTLERIAWHGAEDFYRGGIAARAIADMEANGALLGRADFESVATEESAPLAGSYRGLRVASVPPPGGGMKLIEMLNILEHFDLRSMGHNSPDYIATVAEAMKIGAVDRDRHLGDPRFVTVPVETLTAKDYAAEKADQIRRGVKAHVPRLEAEAADTTQCTVVDGGGACVSLTHTLGTPSGVITDGLGFMWNGGMSAFDPRPGRAGSLAPGKARPSSMAPTIMFRDGKPFFVVGAPGGTYITPGVLQAILNVVEFGMTALEAIHAPRFVATSDTIWLTNRIPRATERELVRRGYPVQRSPLTFHFAGVHGIRIVDGRMDGAADPGRDGVAMSA